MDPVALKKANALRKERAAFAIVTEMDRGRDRVVTVQEAESVPGEMGAAIARSISSGKAGLVEIGGVRFFINPSVPALRIVIVGAVHIAQALAKIAVTADYDVEVIDPRSAFADASRFADVPLSAAWPEEALAERPLDAYCALVALSHDPKIDDPPLVMALKAGCIYVGALGSQKTHKKRLDRLKDLGVAESSIKRIHSPVGLNIGAATPAEIAVSIMAEIILAVRGAKPSV